MKPPVLMCACILPFVGAFLACAGAKPPPPVEPDGIVDAGPPDLGPPDTGPKTLYDRLGAKDGVAIVVEALVDRVTKDPKLKASFAHTTGDKLAHFKQMLNEQLCFLSGGPCTYSGKDMRTAHKGMNVTEVQWNAFVADLGDALKEAKVDDDDQSELLIKIAEMKDDVFNRGVFGSRRRRRGGQMKHATDAILRADQAAYLEALEPPRDSLLAKMEAFARERNLPISDPEVASFLAITARARGRSRRRGGYEHTPGHIRPQGIAEPPGRPVVVSASVPFRGPRA